MRAGLDGSRLGCYRSIVASGDFDPQAVILRLRAWVRGASGAAEGPVRPAIVGVLNVTPDSFSDGGRYLDVAAASAQAARLLEDGADVLEIGGESTRPAGSVYGAGHVKVDDATQIARILPVITHAARELRALVAVDTTSVVVAEAALEAGAAIVNDVSCLADVALAELVAKRSAWLVLMHSRPGAASAYDDVVEDVAREWSAARDRAVAAGVPRERIVMDPGIGFGKGAADNFRILASIPRFLELGHPVYVGASRKAFIAAAEERAFGVRAASTDRLGGTLAASLLAARFGAAALRVHEPAPLRQALAVESAILGARSATTVASGEKGRS